MIVSLKSKRAGDHIKLFYCSVCCVDPYFKLSIVHVTASISFLSSSALFMGQFTTVASEDKSHAREKCVLNPNQLLPHRKCSKVPQSETDSIWTRSTVTRRTILVQTGIKMQMTVSVAKNTTVLQLNNTFINVSSRITALKSSA